MGSNPAAPTKNSKWRIFSFDDCGLGEKTARKDHVRCGEELVLRQRKLVEELQARGENAAEARKLLADFEAIQRMHMDHFARLRRG